MSAPQDDGLADLGYSQSLDRSIGKFASFAAGISYISILTGTFQLFYFGFAFGGLAYGGRGRSCSSARSWWHSVSRSWPRAIPLRVRSTTDRSVSPAPRCPGSPAG